MNATPGRVHRAGRYVARQLWAVNALYHARRTPHPAPFVIITSPRSGSTMLRQLLDDHSSVTCRGELLARDATAFRQSSRPPVGLRRRLWSGEGAPGPIGFKLMFQHGTQDRGSVWPYLRGLRQLRVIHLRRADQLAREVSRWRAQRDGVWNLAEERAIPPPHQIALDPRMVIDQLDREHRRSLRGRTMLHRKPMLDVWFEDLEARPDETMARIFRFLGVDPEPVSPRTKKIRSLQLSEEIENWDELRTALLHSPQWRHLVDERPG